MNILLLCYIINACCVKLRYHKMHIIRTRFALKAQMKGNVLNSYKNSLINKQRSNVTIK